MIKSIITTFFLILFSFQLIAQKGEKVMGIFITSKDFANGKLSFVNDSSFKKYKIYLNDLLNKKNITIKGNDSSYFFFKKDIFGYETYDHNIYRFLDKRELLILNPEEEILIFKNMLSGKNISGRTNVTNFYFSIGKEGKAQKLTIKNLKMAFNNNIKFQILIDKNFRYNTDLAGFDEDNKIYKINYLLKETER